MIDIEPEQKLRFARSWRLDGRGCWVWHSTLQYAGYGVFKYKHVQHRAHRFSYRLFVGEIPHGLVLDHLCRNRACVNPEHLEIVTNRENIMRSPVAVAAKNAGKTHCKRGHEFDAENTYSRGPNMRECRICRSINQAAYQKRKKAKANAA